MISKPLRDEKSTIAFGVDSRSPQGDSRV